MKQETLLRPHNDWTGLQPEVASGSRLTAAMVIPVYNRPDLLERTLAGLERSTRQVKVIVVDDGSEADVAAVVAESPLDVTLVAQQHRGYGAGRARNLGARTAGEVDVLIFIDSDCIPDPDLVARHLAWHGTSASLVTIGDRRHVRVADLTAAEIAAGTVDLEERVEAGFSGRLDFRRLLERRTAGLTTGDEAFRTFVSSNVAVPGPLFRAVGGFDERFTRWGGEDTELGWRMWQEGSWIVPAPEARVYHQLDEDESGGQAGRRRSRELNDGRLSTLIPHSFYRRPRRDVIHEVPKVSIVVHDPPETLDDLWADVSGQNAPDWELLLVGCGDGHEPIAGLLAGDPRVSLVGDLETALRRARGELVVTLHGAAALDHRFLGRVVKQFHDRPMTSSLTVGYTLPADPPQVFRVEDDSAWVDANWGGPLPLATVARRRDWAKASALEPSRAWAEIRKLALADHLAQGLVWVPEAGTAVKRPPGFVGNRPTRAEMLSDLRSKPARAARTGAKIIRSRYQGVPYSIPTAAPMTPDPVAESRPVHARYVGWVGYDNLGDEAMLEAFRRLMPWATVEVTGAPRDLLLLGGGTLINRNTYLGWLTERDSPRIERAVIGTGVADPAYWGVTERPEDWARWLSSCAYVGVRGPRSVETLGKWGYDGPIEVCGDSALLFARPGVEAVEGRIVVSPAWTGDDLYGDSDAAVFKTLAESVRGWVAQGRDVCLLSCNPADDRPSFEIMRDAGSPELPYLAGYLDLDAALELLATAELVVGERLHAAVLAAAVGTPFVAVEYQPKLGDFMASVEAEKALVRTDNLTPDTLAEAAAHAISQAGVVAGHVSTYRERLRAAADLVHGEVRG